MELATLVISSGLLGVLLGHVLASRRDRRRRKENAQGLVNRLTVRLGELAESIDDLRKRQWELSLTAYEEALTPEELEALKSSPDEAAAISKSAGRAASELIKALLFLHDQLERQDAIAERQALEAMELFSPPTLDSDPEVYGEFFHLVENRRYHLWADNLRDIEDRLGLLAHHLYSHALDKDAKADLRVLKERSHKQRIGEQALEAVVAGAERHGGRVSWWRRIKWRRRMRLSAHRLYESVRQEEAEEKPFLPGRD